MILVNKSTVHKHITLKKYINNMLRGFLSFGDLSLNKIKIKNLQVYYTEGYRLNVLNQDIDNAMKKLKEENEKIKIF